LAVCLILWKLNVFNLPISLAGVSVWGLILAVIMIVILFHSIMDLSFGGIFFPIAILCIIFDDALGITAITPWVVLIAALLLTIAFDKLMPTHKKHINITYENNDRDRSFNFADTDSTSDDGRVVSHSMKFGSSTKYIRSQNLEAAELSSQFGEMSVFFDQAAVPGKKVVIDCSVSFGEMQLFIPRDWIVDNKVSVTLGDCTDKTSHTTPAGDSVLCIIQGNVSFGELQIVRV